MTKVWYKKNFFGLFQFSRFTERGHLVTIRVQVKMYFDGCKEGVGSGKLATSQWTIVVVSHPCEEKLNPCSLA